MQTEFSWLFLPLNLPQPKKHTQIDIYNLSLPYLKLK